MPPLQLKYPYTVVTVSCGRCKQEQVVQILARSGFWLRVRQSVKCLKCGQEFEVMLPDAIIGGPFLPQRPA
jgi:transcription elongation factor Elf1